MEVIRDFKKNIKIFLLMFLLPILCIKSSLAEYILVKKTDTGVEAPSFEDYELAIEVVMNWQFPLYLRNPEILKSLSRQDLEFLCNHEKQFIEQKLEEAGSNLKLIFISTIVYELLIFSNRELFNELCSFRGKRCYEDDFIDDGPPFYLFNKAGGIDIHMVSSYADIDEGDRSTTIFAHSSMFSFFKKYHESCDFNNDFSIITKKYYMKVNNFIFKFICKNKGRILLTLFASLNKQSHSNRRISVIVKNFIFFKQVYRSDRFAYICGYFPLYRGTDLHKSGELDVLMNEKEVAAYRSYGFFNEVGMSGYGLSYGNSIFAGSIYGDASAYHHSFKLEFFPGIPVFSYSIFISKLDYTKKFIENFLNPYITNDMNSVLYISPVGTLNGLISDGELFHSRFVHPISVSDDDAVRIKGMFSEYLKSHVFILKRPQNISVIDILGLNDVEELRSISIPYKNFMACTPIKRSSTQSELVSRVQT